MSGRNPSGKTLLLALALVATAVGTSGCDMLRKVTPENANGVLYVYTLPHCSACRVAKPVVEKLKQEGFNIKVINVRKSPEKAGKAGIHMVPTFVHYDNGKETKRIVGTASEAELRNMFR